MLAALERALGWPELARSPQLGRFLNYIVEHTLDGDDQSIKAYSIAVDVFGRSADFDPQVDPIVRVQARRLRGLLEHYYATAGASDPVRITLPTGRYVPLFVAAPSPEAVAEVVPPKAPAAGQRGGGVTLSWFTLCLATLGVAALAYSLSSRQPPPGLPPATLADSSPSVTIVEFQDLTGPSVPKPQVAGLAPELVTDLDAFEDIDVRYDGRDVARQGGVPLSDFVLTGIVRRAEQGVLYSAILTETASGAVVWNHTIAVNEAKAAEGGALDETSNAISLVLGSPRGPLDRPERQMLTSEPQAAGSETPYSCHLLFEMFREAETMASGRRAAACFSALSETERQAPQALAAVAGLTSANVMAEEQPDITDADRLRIAGSMLERALAASPVSGFVWEQQARWLEGQSHFEAANAAYASSLQMNPANADALAAYARLLALQGQLSKAEQLSTRALQAPQPPPWYFLVPALLALRDNDLPMAVSTARTYAAADPELGSVLAVVAALRSGDGNVVNRYLPQVLEVASFKADGILPRLERRVGDQALIAMIRTALVEAGVPLVALAGPF